ncbi:MAG: hypothetical protein Q8904_10875 [Bacteroidota bacterium]|nr:hypothetical protein [Bacteroidota bacterium]
MLNITQISDNNGNLAAEYSYDAWGGMRNPVNWQIYAQGTPVLPNMFLIKCENGIAGWWDMLSHLLVL